MPHPVRSFHNPAFWHIFPTEKESSRAEISVGGKYRRGQHSDVRCRMDDHAKGPSESSIATATRIAQATSSVAEFYAKRRRLRWLGVRAFPDKNKFGLELWLILGMSDPGLFQECHGLFVNRQNEAACFADDTMGAAGRVYHQSTGGGAAVLIALRSCQHQDVLVSGLLMQGDFSGFAKTDQCRRGACDAVTVEAVDIDAIEERCPGNSLLIPREIEHVVQFDALVLRDWIGFRSGDQGWEGHHGELNSVANFTVERL